MMMFGQSRGSWPVRVAVAAGVVLAIAAIVLMALWLARPERHHFVLTTGGDGGTYLPLGHGLAKVISDTHPTSDVEVVESSGAVENMARLQSGEADFAFIQNDTAGASSVRTVVPLYREVLHFLVRNDSGITSLRDIRGRRVSIGERGSGTEAVVTALLGHYDLNMAQFQPHFSGAGKSADMLVAGEVDAMLFVGGIKSDACQRAVASGLVRFVGLGTAGVDAGEIEGFRFDYPFAEPYVIPLRTYSSPNGGKPERPIATISIRAILATRGDMPDDVVRLVTAAVFSGRSELIRTHGNAAEIRERFDETWLQYALHPGAQSYYQRDEPGFLITYAELMGFILSVLVFLFAAFVSLREAVLRRKKNRIDVYYTRLDEILTELRTAAPSLGRLDELDLELSEMQRRAFRQLVDERLRADESFRIFQDFLAECKAQIIELRAASHSRGSGE